MSTKAIQARQTDEPLLSDLQKAYTSLGRLRNSTRHKKIILEIERKIKQGRS